MRVVQLMGTSGGGVVRHVAAVSAALMAAGETVVAIGPEATLADLGRLVTGVRAGRPVDSVPVAIGDRPHPRDLLTLLRLRRLLSGTDVVHAHGVRAGALAALAARLRRRRPAVVVTVHNGPPSARGAAVAFGVLELLVARGADEVLVVSGDLGERMLRRGARRVERALVPAPPPRTAATVADEREPGLVVMAARLAPQKAPELLLDAVAQLTRAGTHPLRAVLAGDGPLQSELVRRATDEALPVDVPGRVDDVDALLRRADVVVLTSRWEGQPLVLQEALRAGAAIVATDVGGVAEVCGDAAVLVPWPRPDTTPAPVDAFADAVRALLADPPRARALREAASRRAAELPTEADTLAQLLDTYAVAFARLRRS